MNPTERRRAIRRHHVIALSSVLLAGTTTACAPSPPHAVQPASSALSVTPVPGEGRRGVPPKPKPLAAKKPRAKPRVVVTPKIGTALAIRHLKTTVYCYGQTTYTGHHVFRGLAAVKTSSGIPFGAVLHVGGRRYVVDDREPAYGVSDVDLYWGDEANCEHLADVYGIQRRAVEIERAA